MKVLSQTLPSLQNEILEIEGVDNENEGREIEGLDSETERVDNEVLPPEQKGCHLFNPPTINYNDGRSNQQSMGWINLVGGHHAFHNVAKTYANIINAIATFVEPTPPTNIITNETFLTQYSIKQGLRVLG